MGAPVTRLPATIGRIAIVIVAALPVFMMPRLAASETASTDSDTMVVRSEEGLSWYRHSFDVMGTRASVELASASHQLALDLERRVEAEMRRIETLMSPYIGTSALAAINRLAAGETQVVDAELFKVIDTAQWAATISRGAFDITFASAGFLYDYRNNIQPADASLESVLPRVNYRDVVLDHNASSLSFRTRGMQIDLGGIAKGYAVDRSIDILRRAGIESALVVAGGDSRVLGSRAVERSATGEHTDIPWVVAIQHPRDETSEVLRLPLRGEAISTSGDYQRYFIDTDGRRVHHILNPSTGRSAALLASASVIGPQSMVCDALSTAVFVLGVEEGLAMIDTLPGYETFVVDLHGKVHYSGGLTAP